jgi:hypothetical protein
MSELDQETLDPDDWDELTSLGHEMLDDMMNFLRNIRSQPFKTPTESVINEIMTPLKDQGDGEKRHIKFSNGVFCHIIAS